MLNVTPKNNEPKTPQDAFKALANKDWFKDAKKDFPDAEEVQKPAIKDELKTYDQLVDTLSLCSTPEDFETFETECKKDLQALQKNNPTDYTKLSAMIEMYKQESINS